MTTAIFENSSKLLACVASVSNRVFARMLERKQKKDWRGRGRGEEEEVPSFPSPSPVIHFFFLPLSQFSRRTSRGNACYALRLRSCALLSSWRHDGQDRPDKQTYQVHPPPPPVALRHPAQTVKMHTFPRLPIFSNLLQAQLLCGNKYQFFLISGDPF